jgi:tetratricopeptide (TPR) repeat protein
MRNWLRTFLLSAAVAGSAASVAASLAANVGCGASAKPPKGKDPAAKKKARKLLAEARDAARTADFVLAHGKYQEAYKVTGDVDIVTEEVDVLIAGGELLTAEEVAVAYVAENRNDIRGLGLLADAYLAQNKFKPALKAADDIVELDDTVASGHERRGRALLGLARTQEAVDSLRQSVALDGESTSALVGLGNALMKAGQFNDAALQYRAAYKRAPDDPQVLIGLATAVREQREYSEAQKYLDHAIELDPKSAEAQYEMGILLNRMSDAPGAENALAAAVRLGPRESRYWYAYGEIFRLQRKVDQAIDSYQKAVNLPPQHPKAASKLAALLVERKDYDAAERILTVAIRKDGRNPINYLQLGSVYVGKKRPQQAIEMLQKYLELAGPEEEERKRVKEMINEPKKKGS